MTIPHHLFHVWSPDEVAECLEGVGIGPIYNQLWDLVAEYDKKPRSEVNDDFDDRCLAKFWDKLPEETQNHLNACAIQQMGDFDEV